MENVYICTSRIIKEPTVHCISMCVRVVPVLAWMLKLGNIKKKESRFLRQKVSLPLKPWKIHHIRWLSDIPITVDI